MITYEEDNRLSLKDKGIMSVLLYLEKEGKSPNATNVAEYTTGKYPTIRSGLKVLTMYGYYKVERSRTECGFSYKYTLNATVDPNIVIGEEE